MALGLTQPLTEMSTRNISWGGGGDNDLDSHTLLSLENDPLAFCILALTSLLLPPFLATIQPKQQKSDNLLMSSPFHLSPWFTVVLTRIYSVFEELISRPAFLDSFQRSSNFLCICRQPKTYVKPEAAITVIELLMIGGVSPETF
jgi:hypothetical protein